MPKKILIIDDDRAIAQLTSLWMKAAGYETDLAFSGEGGLEKAQADPPDLILLDIRMPDIDGFQVQAGLNKSPSLADVPVVFLSANVQEDVRNAALLAGACAFIAKPYESKDIVDVVQRALAA